MRLFICVLRFTYLLWQGRLRSQQLWTNREMKKSEPNGAIVVENGLASRLARKSHLVQAHFPKTKGYKRCDSRAFFLLFPSLLHPQSLELFLTHSSHLLMFVT